MPQANLRNSGEDPYLYLEGNSGSTAVGIVGATDVFNIVVVPSASDIEPDSGNPSISIDPAANGDIEFRPKGTGQSTFVNGNVEIQGTGGTPGNLMMQDTTAAGLSGVIEFGGDRFIHKYGTDNTFIGELSGTFSLTTGSSFGNTAVGSDSMNDLTVGAYNTAVGLRSGASITTGNQNNSFGQDSLTALTTGSYNAAIGANAGYALTTGSYNTLIGFQVGDNYTTSESSNIILGNNVHGTVGESNTIRIGQQGGSGGQQNRCFIAGITGVTLGTPVGTVQIDANGQLGIGTGNTLTWTEVVGTSANMAVNNGYIANNAGLVTLTLPTTAAIGDVIIILGKGTGLWSIAQNANQTIHYGTTDTTTGVGGSFAATQRYDCVTLRCITANTDFIAFADHGTFTVT